MRKDIEFTLKGSVYSIPNSWEGLNTYQFKELVADLISMSAGKLSAGLVRVRHICRVMGWDINKITDADAMGNIACLAEQVTFPFLICYPDMMRHWRILTPTLMSYASVSRRKG